MMNKLVKRGSLVFVGAATLAGSVLGVGAAQAATPGDLKVTTAVTCQDKQTVRLVVVQNVGETTITGVRVGSAFGPEVRVTELDKKTFTDPVKKGNLRFASPSGVAKNGELAKGESFWLGEVLPGCGGPYALVGYSIGDQIDNVFNAPNYDLSIDLNPAAEAMAAD